MNKLRRKEIGKAIQLLDEAKEILETARDEEQEYFDSMPESLQGGDKGQEAEIAVGILDDVVSMLDDALASVGDAI